MAQSRKERNKSSEQQRQRVSQTDTVIYLLSLGWVVTNLRCQMG